MTTLFSRGFIKQIKIPVALMGLGLSSMTVLATDPSTQGSFKDEQKFPTPDAAAQALLSAVKVGDKTALQKIFGSQAQDLMTADPVQDQRNMKKFARVISQSYKFEKVNENQLFLDVGEEEWPLPIPLKSENGQWYFDTAAGKEEIICRNIGEDELHAIGVCRAYVQAQRRYRSENPLGDGAYALHLKSAPGSKDGLYWPEVSGQPESPFGPLLAEAQSEGFSSVGRMKPFHGYCFKILTRQGAAAPGGAKAYLVNGKLIGGFALVAYPAKWNQSGVMTFIVNQTGRVYQQNLGPSTPDEVQTLSEYDPTPFWTMVKDVGISDFQKKIEPKN